MTRLKKPVKRVTSGTLLEHGKKRPIIIILRPPNIVAFRAKGCKKEYVLTAEAGYTLAVRAHAKDKERQKRIERKRKKTR